MNGRTGFVGIGEFFLQKGLFVLVERETQKNKVGSSITSKSSTTSREEVPRISSPIRIKKTYWCLIMVKEQKGGLVTIGGHSFGRETLYLIPPDLF